MRESDSRRRRDGQSLTIIIPVYNERSSGIVDFDRRIEYFAALARRCKAICDIFVVDDGSTDGGLDVLRRFVESSPDSFSLISVKPNANKVGAIQEAVSLTDSDYVLLSDFDTDLLNIERVDITLNTLRNNPDLMGCYLRMLPFCQSNVLVQYQTLEYALARARYSFFRHEGTVPVMPGAGSIYRREVIKAILSEHSGERNGEDRESAMIGLRLGYKVFYEDNMLAVTRTPTSYVNLRRQRARWNLGYLQTVFRESNFYLLQVRRFTRLGRQVLLDMGMFLAILLGPVLIFAFLMIDPMYACVSVGAAYVLNIFWVTLSLARNHGEIADSKKCCLVVPIFLPLWIAVEYPAWICALWKILKKDRCRAAVRLASIEVNAQATCEGAH